METREITVVSTKTQKKSVIMSAATTLAELKSDLRQAGIDYEGMTFYEGISRTELVDNNSVLPSNVMYKGQPTNKLVFMLTNTNKKIRSGADNSRAEAYAFIKEHGLQNECFSTYGKHYTRCKTSELQRIVRAFAAHMEQPECCCSNTNTPDTTNQVETRIENIEATLENLINILYEENCISCNQSNFCKGVLHRDSISSYTDDEISEMFDFVK